MIPRTMRLAVLLLVAFLAPTTASLASETRALPGPAGAGRVRLPNGWYLSPAGRQVGVGDLPLGLAVSPDERFAAVTYSGWKGRGLDLVDLAAGKHVQTIPLRETWLGVAFLDQGSMLAVSAAGENRVLLYSMADGRASLADSIVIGPKWSAGGQYPQGKKIHYGPGAIWTTGLSADAGRKRLYVVSQLDSALNVLDVPARRMQRRVALGAVPYTCLVSRDGARIFVSLWSSASVAIVDAASLEITRVIPVGDHRTDLAESRDGSRVFVANSNANTVAVVDVAAGRTLELLRTSRTPDEPAGDMPNGLTLDEKGERLYVANAGANHVAVFDVNRPGRSQAIGFLPTGWYPTALRFLPRSRTLIVANGKGAGSSPSKDVVPDTSKWCRYLQCSPNARGTLSLITEPDGPMLERLTRNVFANSPELRRRAARKPPPIQHVFYIIKENRSYDQLLGDLPQGNGDSTLAIFGEQISPNHHALAREFVLLDNTYCDSDGSADGHNWGMGAISNDYVAKEQSISPIYDYEGGNPLAYPSAGYIWDLCAKHGISYRSYGEFVFNGATPSDTVRAGIAGLIGHIAPRYLGYDTNYSDLDRYRAWLEEFDRYDRDGGLPQLSIIRLPNDHTEGTCTNRPTPRAHMAENDLALGMMVERISHSRYWKGALILVIEDDAANGQDHVDGHRTVALAAGPYVKRGQVDSHLYTSCSVLRCIEDVFGLPPMTQFDARANGLEGIFRSTPELRPYVHRNARIDIDEKNLAGAFGQAESDAMNFAVADAVPYDRLNVILWHSVSTEPPPPVVRSGFALQLGLPAREDDDDH
jgi:DNA-binding beta-propeller fold protein YncE